MKMLSSEHSLLNLIRLEACEHMSWLGREHVRLFTVIEGLE